MEQKVPILHLVKAALGIQEAYMALEFFAVTEGLR